MDNYYKYRTKIEQTNPDKEMFVGQMLDTKRDNKFSFRLPACLKQKLENEPKSANILIKFLAEKYFIQESIYDKETWEEETKDWT
jgi:hypothetical protein